MPTKYTKEEIEGHNQAILRHIEPMLKKEQPYIQEMQRQINILQKEKVKDKNKILEQQEDIERLKRDGKLRKCDIPACNCNGYHSVYASRMVELADENEHLKDELHFAESDIERLQDSHRVFHDDVIAAMEILELSIHARSESDHVVFRTEVLPAMKQLKDEVEVLKTQLDEEISAYYNDFSAATSAINQEVVEQAEEIEQLKLTLKDEREIYADLAEKHECLVGVAKAVSQSGGIRGLGALDRALTNWGEGGKE